MSSGECVAENVIALDHQVAVLVPCHNEGRAVAGVVADSRAALPAAAVYVNMLDIVTRGRRQHKLQSHRALRAPGEERRS
jgi:hypothetical protein